MKIIKPSVEIINPIDYKTMLNTTELAIRNCYDSYNKMKEGSAEGLIRGCIKSGHDAVLEFGDICVKLITDRAVMSQITRHRIGTSFCVSGDTILKSYSGKTRTIKELYERFHTPSLRGSCKALRLRSINDAYTIVPNKIIDVFYNGKKDVYRLTTESGRSIKTTLSHEFLMGDGHWRRLSEISVGDFIYVNGKELLDNYDWLYHNYIELNRKDIDVANEIGCSIWKLRTACSKFGIHKASTCKGGNFSRLTSETKDALNNYDLIYDLYIKRNKTRREVAEYIGCCESYVNRACKKLGIVKPHSKYPNRQPGYFPPGILSVEQRKKISQRMSGVNNPHWIANTDDLSIGGGYNRTRLLYGKTKVSCEFCGSTNNLEMHHVDKNPRNSSKENIKILCTGCHHLWHHQGKIGAFKDKVVAIEYVGKEDVYDLEMEAPYHNYVANSIVVHNCVRSQRYVNYAKGDMNIEFIEPKGLTNDAYDNWKGACKVAEAAYLVMVNDCGMKPETARSVLPNCTATTIYMKANIREWRHILSLRCHVTAQTEIRELMLDALAQFYKLYPIFFEDIYNEHIGIKVCGKHGV